MSDCCSAKCCCEQSILMLGAWDIYLTHVTDRRPLTLLCDTYMRVEREVQVLSELGDRGATPVLEHMQVGLALILATHRERKQVSRWRNNSITFPILVALQCFSHRSSHPRPQDLTLAPVSVDVFICRNVCRKREKWILCETWECSMMFSPSWGERKRWQSAHQGHREGRGGRCELRTSGAVCQSSSPAHGLTFVWITQGNHRTQQGQMVKPVCLGVSFPPPPHTHTHTNPCFCACSYTRRDDSLMTCMSNLHGCGSEVLNLTYCHIRHSGGYRCTDSQLYTNSHMNSSSASSCRRLSQRFDDLGSLTFILDDRTTHRHTHICHPSNAWLRVPAGCHCNAATDI